MELNGSASGTIDPFAIGATGNPGASTAVTFRRYCDTCV